MSWVTIDNFEDQKLCTSPRTLDACRLLGVLPNELLSRTVSPAHGWRHLLPQLDSFRETHNKSSNEPWALQMRRDRFEQRRQQTVPPPVPWRSPG